MPDDPEPRQRKSSRDKEAKYQSLPFIDLMKGPLFTRAIKQLPKLSDRHQAAGYEQAVELAEDREENAAEAIFGKFSACNLKLVMQDCEENIPAEERAIFEARFKKIRFFWKHGTPVFDLVQEIEALSSITRLVEREHGPAVFKQKNEKNPWGKNQFHHAYIPDPKSADGVKKVMIGSTSIPQLDFRGDGGFVFFRFNIGDGPMPDSRFGAERVQMVLNPKADPRLHTHGWVTLRDVFYPYGHREWDTGKFVVTCEASQRISTYQPLTPEVIADAAPFTDEEIIAVGKIIKKAYGTPPTGGRQVFVHEFRPARFNADGSERARRREHVLEGAFHGKHIEPGVLFSAMRAMWEMEPLWERVIAEDLTDEGFRDLMKVWLHKFFHIEAKYPWKLDLKGIESVINPLVVNDDQDGNPEPEEIIWDADNEDQDPVIPELGQPYGFVYFPTVQPKELEELTLDDEPTTSFADEGSLDYASDASLDATTSWS